MAYILKFIGLAILYIILVLVIFVGSPFLLALIEIIIFHPSDDSMDWIIWLAIQTILICFVNIIICENIRLKIFKDYAF